MKKVFTLLLLFMTAGVALAEESEVNALVISGAGEGTDVTYLFSAEPKFVVGEEEITFSCGAVEFSISKEQAFEVSYVKAAGTATAVDALKTGATVSVLDGVIEIRTAANESVAVYNVQGTQVLVDETDGNGAATIGTDGLGRGVYIVKTKGVCFKFVK